MNRRTLLAWLSRMLAATSTLLITIPGFGFFFSQRQTGPRKRGLVQRVARLNDLPVGKPVQVSVLGARRDAWTTYPDEIIGRVWLVRAADSAAAQGQPVVKALTSVCPHLGCTVQLDNSGKQFVCPCHRAAFAADGSRLSEKGHPSHAPRDLDSLDCRIVAGEQGEQWVEVDYQQFEQGLTTRVAKV